MENEFCTYRWHSCRLSCCKKSARSTFCPIRACANTQKTTYGRFTAETQSVCHCGCGPGDPCCCCTLVSSKRLPGSETGIVSEELFAAAVWRPVRFSKF